MVQRMILCSSILLMLVGSPGQAEDKAAKKSDPDRATIRNFALPEYNEQMELVSKIEGDEAEVGDHGDFLITNLRFQMFKNGKVDARVTSPLCTYSKRRNEGWSKSSIRITREDLVVTGEDYKFSGKNERIHIRKNAKVVLRSVDIRIWGDDDEK